MKMKKRTWVKLICFLILLPNFGCSEVDTKKRNSVAEAYADFVDGTVISCQHPKWSNESSECLIEMGFDCKRMITVGNVSSELKDEICLKD